jgi:predicted MPP superfamily phosphohydrolase
MSTFKITEYYLESGKIKAPVRAVFLTDLHNREHGKGNRELLEAIYKKEPDFVLIGGDLLIGKEGKPVDVPVRLIEELSQRYPVYYGYGNHESRMAQNRTKYGGIYDIYEEVLLSCGVHLLRNQTMTVGIKGNLICIAGLEIDQKYYEKFNRYTYGEKEMTEDIGIRKGEIYHILLAHNPVYFPTYAQWGADLTLSGHLHGGIIRLPVLGGVITPQAKLFPRYDKGLYQLEDRKLIVGAGLGGHTIDIRINNPTELIVIDIDKEAVCKGTT